MKETVRYYRDVCLHPQHLRRTLTITLLVGTWLTAYNQGSVLLSTGVTPPLAGRVLLNYLTPFLVANWGLVSREADGDH